MSTFFKKSNVSVRHITYTPIKTKSKKNNFFSQDTVSKVVNLGIGKRQKIIIAALLLAFGLLITHSNAFLFMRTRLVLLLGISAYLISLWALWEGMNKTKAIVLMILPVFFTVAVASFYFLLPIRWLTRLPEMLIFGFLFYSLLLAQNVFNVASQRTIPLYRAASTVSFLFTLITAFLLYNVIYAFQMSFYWNAILVSAVSFPLILQMLWHIKMEGVSSKIIIYSLVVALLIGEAALVFSFWPVVSIIWSLFLAAFLYVILAIITDFLRDRLDHSNIVEYISVGGIVITASIIVSLFSN
jgi:hypothetical protein